MSASYNRTYYAEHKNDILKQMARPEFCPVCKKHITHGYMTKHLNAPRHIRLKQLANQEQAEKLESELIYKLALLSLIGPETK